ncbi:MAG TPA: carboxymuconolactone decarboxylase family protein [Bordetella sp.]|nr:carboxymuconolactone decarboxylase family protein [Bordetella sp.]
MSEHEMDSAPGTPPTPPGHAGAADASVADVGDATAIRQRIDAIRAGRGYVLPSHAILAVGNPTLLARYEDVFSAITYQYTSLSPFEKNFVWLVVIGCAQTPTGAAHLKDFVDAGGTVSQAEAASSLAAVAHGAPLYDTIAPGWRKVLPGYSPERAYRDAIDRVIAGTGLPAGLVDMALAAGQACRASWDKVTRHILNAKQAGISDDALAEALTVVILPAGNPAFVQASAIWRDLISTGQVEASAAYRYACDAI